MGDRGSWRAGGHRQADIRLCRRRRRGPPLVSAQRNLPGGESGAGNRRRSARKLHTDTNSGNFRRLDPAMVLPDVAGADIVPAAPSAGTRCLWDFYIINNLRCDRGAVIAVTDRVVVDWQIIESTFTVVDALIVSTRQVVIREAAHRLTLFGPHPRRAFGIQTSRRTRRPLVPVVSC